MTTYYSVKLSNHLRAMTNDLPALINYLIETAIDITLHPENYAYPEQDNARVISITPVLLNEFNEGSDFYYPELP
jgi:hypothetical protein